MTHFTINKIKFNPHGDNVSGVHVSELFKEIIRCNYGACSA